MCSCAVHVATTAASNNRIGNVSNNPNTNKHSSYSEQHSYNAKELVDKFRHQDVMTTVTSTGNVIGYRMVIPNNCCQRGVAATATAVTHCKRRWLPRKQGVQLVGFLVHGLMIFACVLLLSTYTATLRVRLKMRNEL